MLIMISIIIPVKRHILSGFQRVILAVNVVAESVEVNDPRQLPSKRSKLVKMK